MYRVIKSNCYKKYLYDEPKKYQKWPYPMIFRKHLCGGFGILISQNAQVEKILHFSVVPKMVGLLQHGSILPGLNPQVTPKDSQSSFDIPKYHPD